jgi:hypothetical protein
MVAWTNQERGQRMAIARKAPAWRDRIRRTDRFASPGHIVSSRRVEQGESKHNTSRKGEKWRMIVGGVLLIALVTGALILFVLVVAPHIGGGSSNENAEVLRNLVWPH